MKLLNRVAEWGLWRLPRHAVIALLSVELLAVTVTVCMYRPVTTGQVTVCASAALLSICYSLLSTRWEGTRLLLSRGARFRVTANLLAIWCFFAATVVPAQLAVLVVIVAELGSLPARGIVFRVNPYRIIYSASTNVLAACAAAFCMSISAPWILDLCIAAVVWIAVGIVVMALALAVTQQPQAVRLMFTPSSHYVEVVTVLIAMAQAFVYREHGAVLLWLTVPAALALQWPAVRKELKREAEPDERPMVEEAWQLVAREVVAASDAAAVMRIDTGDPVAVTLVARVQAGCDAIGQNGPNGLAILLTDCPGPNADAIAARMRSALQGNKIEGHVAVAAKPRDGQTLADLLAVSEAELIAMEAASQAEQARPGEL